MSHDDHTPSDHPETHDHARARADAARPPAPVARHDPALMRARYRASGLLEAELPDSPWTLFARWFAQTASSELHEPNAMVVSTADQRGRPSSRTVLLKRYDERGFVFFTNYASRKGRELTANPWVSLLFPWHALARQVMVTGVAERTGRDETAAYFRTRPHGSQLGAWASDQSAVLDSRDELDRHYAELAERYPEGSDIPAPPTWGGYRVRPESIEFWQGRDNRLHDRLRYTCDLAAPGGQGDTGSPGAPAESARWRVERLGP